MLLVMLPIVALIFTLPPMVTVVALWTTPADTVARLLSLVFQVATSATGKSPLHVTAVAVNVSVRLLAVNAEALVGMLIWLIHPTVTVTVCVPVAAGFLFDAGVAFVVAQLNPFTQTFVRIVAA